MLVLNFFFFLVSRNVCVDSKADVFLNLNEFFSGIYLIVYRYRISALLFLAQWRVAKYKLIACFDVVRFMVNRIGNNARIVIEYLGPWNNEDGAFHFVIQLHGPPVLSLVTSLTALTRQKE